ncbi:Beta-1,3-galactosyltransferase 1 [Thelohanellus kitauei]|nr:Beta-1,3-galactosyltransferase 1 [Thelohanellus kitauei]
MGTKLLTSNSRNFYEYIKISAYFDMKKVLPILAFLSKKTMIVLKFSILFLCLYVVLRVANHRHFAIVVSGKSNAPITNISHGQYNFYDLDYFPSFITISELFRPGPFPLNDSLIDQMVLHTKSVFEKNCHDTTELVVFIISGPHNFDMRQNIRNALGKDSPHSHVLNNSKPTKEHCTLFSIGYTSDVRLNQQVDWEAYTKGDVIRVPLIESYRETAHKIILTLFLLNKMKGSFQYILKIDDDIFVRINKLLPYIRKLTESQVFIGHVAKNKGRVRDPKHKWYVSDLDYPDKVYKPYVLGFSELFRRNIIDRLAAQHSKTHLIPMEDIHISYLVNKLGYNLTNEPRFYYCNNPQNCRNRFVVDIGKNIQNRNKLIASIQSEQDST